MPNFLESFQENFETLGQVLKHPGEAFEHFQRGRQEAHEEEEVGIHNDAELQERKKELETAVAEFIQARNAGFPTATAHLEQLISLGNAIRGYPRTGVDALRKSIGQDIIKSARSASRRLELIPFNALLKDLQERHGFKGGKSRRRKSRRRKSRRRTSRKRKSRKK